MSTEISAPSVSPQPSLWSLVRGWNGVKLGIALVAVSLWFRREMALQWFYGSREAYWDSGVADWWIWDVLHEFDFFVLLLQIGLVVAVLATRLASPRWRTVLLVGALLWMAWSTAGDPWRTQRFLSSIGRFGSNPLTLFRDSPLWFALYSLLLAWVVWDDERLTVRLIVATVLSTLLFRYWVFDGIGRSTFWVVLLFAHTVLMALGVGLLRLSKWEWRAKTDVSAPSQEIDERRQFGFFHLLLAVSCAAVLVVGVRPTTQLYVDLKSLYETWSDQLPREWPLLVALPVGSTFFSLLGIAAALGRRRWWWPLAAAVVLSAGGSIAATAYVESLTEVQGFPFARYTGFYRWPASPWRWFLWCLLLAFAPFALLAAVQSAGYRWWRRRRPPKV